MVKGLDAVKLFEAVFDIKRVHSLKTIVFNCQECSKTFKQKPYLKNHIEILHSTSNKLNCSECLKKFSGKLYLTSHIKLVHSKLENGQVFQINIILGNQKRW